MFVWNYIFYFRFSIIFWFSLCFCISSTSSLSWDKEGCMTCLATSVADYKSLSIFSSSRSSSLRCFLLFFSFFKFIYMSYLVSILVSSLWFFYFLFFLAFSSCNYSSTSISFLEIFFWAIRDRESIDYLRFEMLVSWDSSNLIYTYNLFYNSSTFYISGYTSSISFKFSVLTNWLNLLFKICCNFRIY